MLFKHRYAEGDQRLGERRSKQAAQSEKEGDMEMDEIKGGRAPSNRVGFQGPRTLSPMNNTPRA
jgi:palmitoyltransferase ZDHHC9/14/18